MAKPASSTVFFMLCTILPSLSLRYLTPSNVFVTPIASLTSPAKYLNKSASWTPLSKTGPAPPESFSCL